MNQISINCDQLCDECLADAVRMADMKVPGAITNAWPGGAGIVAFLSSDRNVISGTFDGEQFLYVVMINQHPETRRVLRVDELLASIQHGRIAWSSDESGFKDQKTIRRKIFSRIDGNDWIEIHGATRIGDGGESQVYCSGRHEESISINKPNPLQSGVETVEVGFVTRSNRKASKPTVRSAKMQIHVTPEAIMQNNDLPLSHQVNTDGQYACIGIITIREDEFLSVHKQFEFGDDPIDKKNGRYFFDNSSGRDVWLGRCVEQGNGEAQALASSIIEDINPDLICVVGIGGGLPSSDYSLGDVAISSRIVDLCVGASIDGADGEYAVGGGPINRNLKRRVLSVLPAMRGKLKGWNDESIIGSHPKISPPSGTDLYGSESWITKVKESVKLHFSSDENRSPEFSTQVVVSSDQLVKDTKLAGQWSKFSRHIGVVEMESSGVFRACQEGDVPFLAIRGISDIVGLKRDRLWTQYACDTAASFAKHFICCDILD